MMEHASVVFAEADALAAAVADDEAPYAPKYQARRLLESVAATADDAGDVALAAEARVRLGVNHVQTEEYSAGVALIRRGVDALRSVDVNVGGLVRLQRVAATVVVGCNHAAAVYAGWDRAPRALVALRHAKRVYGATVRATGPAAPSTSTTSNLDAAFTLTLFYYAQVYAALGCPAISARYCRATLERQVRLRAPLDANAPASPAAFDALEWARNATRLNTFYAAAGQWHAAAACLAAADVVAAGPERARASEADAQARDAWDRLAAEGAMHWGLLYGAVLKAAATGDVGGGAASSAGGVGEDRATLRGSACPRLLYCDSDGDGGVGDALTPGGAAPSQPMTVDVDDSDHEGGDECDDGRGGCGAGFLPFAGFLRAHAPTVPASTQFFGPSALALRSGGGAGPLLPAPGRPGAASPPVLFIPSDVTDFVAARTVFKAGVAALARAASTFVLDGFVTEHVEGALALSRLYKHLAHFEVDPTRRAAMHARRVAALDPLLSELNPALFINLHKEAALDAAAAAAEVFEARMDLGAARAAATPGGAARRAAADAAACRAADDAVRLATHFLRCYADPRLARAAPPPPPAQPSLAGATPLDDASAAAFLTAALTAARVLSRRPDGDVARRAASLASSVAWFEWLLRAVPLVAPPGVFVEELALCREMAHLLRDKLERSTR